MVYLLFGIVILLHAVIHLLGALKEWKPGFVPHLTGATLIRLTADISRFIAFLWFVTCIIFLIAGLGYFLEKEWWWKLAAPGLVLSQALVILYWRDAKAGTVANIVVLVGVALSYAGWSFSRQVREDVERLFADSPRIERTYITQERLQSLPLPVQRWLSNSGVLGKERIHTVQLKQQGLIRTEREGEWMPVEAEQYFNVDEPGFIWKAAVRMSSVISLAGEDRYDNGKGHMLIKLLSLFPVVDATGEDIDRSAMIRYLSEMVWFPSAALNEYVMWSDVDSATARATMVYGGIIVIADFRFDEQGNFLSLTAKRPMAGKTGSTLEEWYIPASEWKEMSGVRIPVRGDAYWKLKEGDFNYFQWEITEIEYNERPPH